MMSERKTIFSPDPTLDGIISTALKQWKRACLTQVRWDGLESEQLEGDLVIVLSVDRLTNADAVRLKQVTDPASALRAMQESQEFNARYGQAIRKLRLASGITQAGIRGLTARQVGRIEKGQCRATSSALKKLAAAHRLALDIYLDSLA